MMRELIGSPVSVGYANRSGGVGSEGGEGVGWWNVIFDYEGFKAHYEVCPFSLLYYSLLLPLRLPLMLSLLPGHLLILLYQVMKPSPSSPFLLEPNEEDLEELMSRWESIRFHCLMPISRFIPMTRGSRSNMIRKSLFVVFAYLIMDLNIVMLIMIHTPSHFSYFSSARR
jgi:hypothetical protein